MLKSHNSSISVHHRFSTRCYFKIPAVVILQYYFLGLFLLLFHDYANLMTLKVATDVKNCKKKKSICRLSLSVIEPVFSNVNCETLFCCVLSFLLSFYFLLLFINFFLHRMLWSVSYVPSVTTSKSVENKCSSEIYLFLLVC